MVILNNRCIDRHDFAEVSRTYNGNVFCATCNIFIKRTEERQQCPCCNGNVRYRSKYSFGATRYETIICKSKHYIYNEDRPVYKVIKNERN